MAGSTPSMPSVPFPRPSQHGSFFTDYTTEVLFRIISHGWQGLDYNPTLPKSSIDLDMYELVHLHVLPEPCKFVYRQQKFYACVSCMKAHETRYCDGTTRHSYKLCESHQKAVDDGLLKPHYEMLTYLRDNVYLGLVPRPLPTSRTVEGSGITGRRIAQNCHALWPTTTQSYEHQCNCIHSDCPETKISEDLPLSMPVPRFSSMHDQGVDTYRELNPNAMSLETMSMLILENLSKTIAEAILNSDLMESLPENIRIIERKYGIRGLSTKVFFKRCNGKFLNSLNEVWQDKEENLEEDLIDFSETNSTTSFSTHQKQKHQNNDLDDNESIQSYYSSDRIFLREENDTSNTSQSLISTRRTGDSSTAYDILSNAATMTSQSDIQPSTITQTDTEEGPDTAADSKSNPKRVSVAMLSLQNSTQHLLARERQVRIGQDTPRGLIMTMWANNKKISKYLAELEYPN